MTSSQLENEPPAAQADPVKQFAGNIAHTFNNLLAVIQGNAELAATGPDRHKHLNTILRATERGTELMSWILSFSQNQMLDPSPTNLQNFIERSAPMLARIVPENIEVVIEHETPAPIVSIDAAQLSTAFLNLVVNARDSIEVDGEITIATGIEQIDDPARAAALDLMVGRYGFLSVSDNGCGIEDANLSRVCEPFFSTKNDDRGVGLGLSMIRGFMKQSGGGLEIVSAPNSGTTVRLFFALSDSSQAAASAIEEKNEVPMGNGESILLIEDDRDLRPLLAMMLEVLNYRVVAFENGEKALDRADLILSGDLVLSDIHLPGSLDGLQLVEKIRAINANLKFILVSANPRLVDNDGILPAGIEDFILKPFTRAKLAKIVHAALARSR